MPDLQFYGTGKRKPAIARVFLRPGGSGAFTVNDRKMEHYFNVERMRVTALAPIHVVAAGVTFDVMVKVKGGGPASQAGAVRHGLSRALLKFNVEFRDKLKKAGFLTRDAREKERKKYGQPGARKRFQYSKR